jgi:hypothetical protein
MSTTLRLRAALPFLLFVLSLHAEESVPVSILGDTLSINGGATKLGPQHWAAPEESWRTVGELLKTALPPGNKEGVRPVVLALSIDDKAPWGAVEALFTAAYSLGVPKVRVSFGKEKPWDLALPGADASVGAAVELPILSGEKLLTENGGQKLELTPALAQGLVKQQPKATVSVKAVHAARAWAALTAIRILREAKAAGVAFMTVRKLTAEEVKDAQQGKETIDRALNGGLGPP